MADKTIGDLTQAESIGSEDLFVLEQGGDAKKLKGARLVKYAQDAVGEQVTAATEAAESAETAKTGAESAQTQAQAARDAILNMIVEAITLESGLPATVDKSIVDSVYKLTFGLPKGEKGDTGPTGPRGKDGAGSMYFRGTTLVIKSGALPPSGDYETYSGDYSVKVPFGGDDAVLETGNKLMRDNLTVEAVNVSETTNPAGGKTMIIGE